MDEIEFKIADAMIQAQDKEIASLKLQNREYREALEYAFGVCCNLKEPGYSWVDDLIDYLGKRLSDAKKPEGENK